MTWIPPWAHVDRGAPRHQGASQVGATKDFGAFRCPRLISTTWFGSSPARPGVVPANSGHHRLPRRGRCALEFDKNSFLQEALGAVAGVQTRSSAAFWRRRIAAVPFFFDRKNLEFQVRAGERLGGD